jgi:hypothetical protein
MASSQAKTRKTGSTKRRSSSKSGGSRDDDVERFRQAAEDALQQLDWTIGYLHGIHKTKISKALAQNRSYIRRHLMGMAEEPLPDQQTDET